MSGRIYGNHGYSEAPSSALQRGHKKNPILIDDDNSESAFIDHPLTPDSPAVSRANAPSTIHTERRTGLLSPEEVECQCCFGDVSPYETITCEAPDAHVFCLQCIRQSANTQIGSMRYKMQCMDISGCQAPFSRPSITFAVEPKVLDTLDSLQQQDEVQQANLEGLESCPFCDYKAIYPPIEDEPNFSCINPPCKINSCRRCRQKNHGSRTCHEDRREHGISKRHRVEEAMTDALIRHCPRCKVAIVKISGCNKLTCPKCCRSMCFVCSKDITIENYRHFEPRSGQGMCSAQSCFPGSAQQVQLAEDDTVAAILQESPSIDENDLRVNRWLPSTDDSVELFHPLMPYDMMAIRHMGQGYQELQQRARRERGLLQTQQWQQALNGTAINSEWPNHLQQPHNAQAGMANRRIPDLIQRWSRLEAADALHRLGDVPGANFVRGIGPLPAGQENSHPNLGNNMTGVMPTQIINFRENQHLPQLLAHQTDLSIPGQPHLLLQDTNQHQGINQNLSQRHLNQRHLNQLETQPLQAPQEVDLWLQSQINDRHSPFVRF